MQCYIDWICNLADQCWLCVHVLRRTLFIIQKCPAVHYSLQQHNQVSLIVETCSGLISCGHRGVRSCISLAQLVKCLFGKACGPVGSPRNHGLPPPQHRKSCVQTSLSHASSDMRLWSKTTGCVLISCEVSITTALTVELISWGTFSKFLRYLQS